jgi:hypothetical protein
MQTASNRISSIHQKAESQLGPIVLQCRNRRRTDAWLALGGSWITIIVTPLFGALFLTMPLIGIAVNQKVPPPLLAHPVWGPVLGGWYVACAAAIYCFFFTAPQAASLVLHENGFRYRKHVVRFTDLARIEGGRLHSPLEEAFLKINRLAGYVKSANRAAVQMAQNSADASLAFVLKDGQPFCMKNALVQYETADLEQVLRAIVTKRADLPGLGAGLQPRRQA